MTDELDPAGRALLERAQGADDPSPADRARVRLRLEAQLAAAAATTALPSAAASGAKAVAGLGAKAWWVGLAVGATLLGAGAGAWRASARSAPAATATATATQGGSAAPAASATSAASATLAGESPRVPERTAASALASARVTERSGAGAAPTRASATALEPGAPPATSQAHRRESARTGPVEESAPVAELPHSPVAQAADSDGRNAQHSSAAPAPTGAEPARDDRCGVAQELSAVTEARRLLATPALALKALDVYEVACGEGALRPERLAVRARALCASGELGAGREVAATLARTDPDSPALPGVRAACEPP